MHAAVENDGIRLFRTGNGSAEEIGNLTGTR